MPRLNLLPQWTYQNNLSQSFSSSNLFFEEWKKKERKKERKKEKRKKERKKEAYCDHL
jgi:hypothetical protein